jgi:hypothetical protein
VWDKITQECQVHALLAPFQKGDVSSWISAISRIPSKQQQRVTARVILFFWWFIWKEMNKRVFDNSECSFLQVSDLIKKAIAYYRVVHLVL